MHFLNLFFCAPFTEKILITVIIVLIDNCEHVTKVTFQLPTKHNRKLLSVVSS